MMSSGKARPENAELERRVKRRPQRLQQKRWPPSCVDPSFVTLTELHRGHTIDNVLLHSAYPPSLLQENRSDCQTRGSMCSVDTGGAGGAATNCGVCFQARPVSTNAVRGA